VFHTQGPSLSHLGCRFQLIFESRYHPEDLHHNYIVKQLKEFKGPAESRLALFQELRSKFRPVMRHYFTERSKNPISWFAMRLGYTRSVSTTSIVGHILGLGDRHTSNILIDNATGEVVHIDLGIAFDQVGDFEVATQSADFNCVR
jgi:serine-protein kinase ATM